MKPLFFAIAFLLLLPHSSKSQRPLWLSAWAESPLPTGKIEGHNIACDAAGNVYTTGTVVDSFQRQYPGAWLSKRSPSGQVLWSKRWSGKMIVSIQQMVVDAQGNVYVAGAFGAYYLAPSGYSDTVYLDGNRFVVRGTSDAFVAKLSTDGQLRWIHQYGGNGSDNATALSLTPSGSFYLAGQFGDTVYFDTTRLIRRTNNDVFLVKGDTAGNLIWAKYLQTGIVKGIGTDGAGNLHLSGFFTDSYAWFGGSKVYWQYSGNMQDATPYIASYDSSLAFNWVRTVWASNGFVSGGSVYGALNCMRMNVLPDGSALLAGLYYNCDIHFQAGPSFSDRNRQAMFLAKYSAAGDVLWAHVGDGTLIGVATGINDAAYVVGYIGSSAQFDNVTIASGPASQEEPVVVQYDSSGIARWGVKATGAGSDYGMDVASSPDGSRLFVTGYTSGPSVQFGPYSISNPGYGNAFVGVLATQPTGVADPALLGPSFQVHPNPATGRVQVQLPPASPGVLTLFDARGVAVRTLPVGYQQAVSLPLDGLPAGPYTLRLQTATGSFARQLIVRP